MHVLQWQILTIYCVVNLQRGTCFPEAADSLRLQIDQRRCPWYCYLVFGYPIFGGQTEERSDVTGTSSSTVGTADGNLCACALSERFWTTWSQPILARTKRVKFGDILAQKSPKTSGTSTPTGITPTAISPGEITPAELTPGEITPEITSASITPGGSPTRMAQFNVPEGAGPSKPVVRRPRPKALPPPNFPPVTLADPARQEARMKGPAATLRPQYDRITCPIDCGETYGFAIFGTNTNDKVAISEPKLVGTQCFCPMTQALLEKLTQRRIDPEVYRTWHNRSPKLALSFFKANRIPTELPPKDYGPALPRSRLKYTAQLCQTDCDERYGFAFFATTNERIATTVGTVANGGLYGEEVCYCPVSEVFALKLRGLKLDPVEYRLWHKFSANHAKRWLIMNKLNDPASTSQSAPVRVSQTAFYSPPTPPRRPRPGKASTSQSTSWR